MCVCILSAAILILSNIYSGWLVAESRDRKEQRKENGMNTFAVIVGY